MQHACFNVMPMDSVCGSHGLGPRASMRECIQPATHAVGSERKSESELNGSQRAQCRAAQHVARARVNEATCCRRLSRAVAIPAPRAASVAAWQCVVTGDSPEDQAPVLIRWGESEKLGRMHGCARSVNQGHAHACAHGRRERLRTYKKHVTLRPEQNGTAQQCTRCVTYPLRWRCGGRMCACAS